MIIAMSTATKTKRSARKTQRFIWSHRERLFIAVAALLLFIVLPGQISLLFSLPIWAALAGLIYWQRARIFPLVHERLQGASVRRHLAKAARDCGFENLKIEKIIMTLPGEWAYVRVPRGKTVDALEKSSRAMAGCLGVSDVRVIPDADDRSRASISVIRRDPFKAIGDYTWPTIKKTETSVREEMLAGFDEYGRQVKVRLLSRNLLIGGAPDSGKSSFLRLPAAYAAKDPKARLWLLDGKMVEFEAWKKCAHAFVSGPDLKGAVEMLTKLRDEMEERYRKIRDAGEVFVLPDMEVDVLMIDEVPAYTRPTVTTDKKEMELIKSIQGLLWTIVARGRAAGVITILSAQKPDANTIPTEIRDLFDNKLALHCNTKAMSDTILGQGAGVEVSANAAEIPPGQPGVGYYSGDEGIVKMKAFYMTHKEAMAIAEEVALRQLDEGLSTITG